MPAPGHQDHTPSPSAPGALVSRTLGVHRILPHVRDDRERPSEDERDGGGSTPDLGLLKIRIFFVKGLDRIW